MTEHESVYHRVLHEYQVEEGEMEVKKRHLNYILDALEETPEENQAEIIKIKTKLKYNTLILQALFKEILSMERFINDPANQKIIEQNITFY